ncbi:hypothetical protein [Streptomyces hydrogenans]|uniref:hypothetical protein n=1 Tax=Streptomyces hydrogenans TaxID=1873719 RepID=UPI0036B6D230
MAADVRRRAASLRKSDGYDALDEIVLREADGRLPTQAIGRPSLVRPQCGSSIEVS